MYNQPEVALAKYDLSAGQITKGRGAYICQTNLGTKLLVPYKGSEERAQLLREIMAFLQEQGMPVEQILATTEGTVLSKDDSETNYILKDCLEGTECNTKNEQELSIAFGELARLHMRMEKGMELIPQYMKNEGKSLLEMCEKHYRELVNVKNYVRSRKKKNEFERLFQGQYEHFAEHARLAISYFGGLEQTGAKQFLCHGDFNQHNVIQKNGEWSIINFEHINFGYPMMDLANFLRKIMEKNNWNLQLGTKLIQSYEDKRVLNDVERRQLGYILLFPEKFWKISNHYGNARKSWVSGRDIEKLEKLVEQEKARNEFLSQIFSL